MELRTKRCGQGDVLAVGHRHAPTRRQRQRATLAVLVALGRYFAAVEGAGEAIFIDAGDGIINGEPGCPSRDGLDFLFHLGGGSGLVVEAAVEIVMGQVVGRDVGLCRGTRYQIQ